MAGSVNKVILIGNLGRDPEVRTFQEGGKVASLNIATSERWKDRKTGDRRERTEWHRVSLLADHTVSVAERYLRKGSSVYIEGQLETRKWQDQSGQDRYTTEVVVRPYRGSLTLLGSGGQPMPGDAEEPGTQDRAGPKDAGRQQRPAETSTLPPPAPAGGPSYGDLEDDEIPF